MCVEMYDERNKVDKIKFINHFKESGYRYLNSIGDNGFFEKID